MSICETLYVEHNDLRELLTKFFSGLGIIADLAGRPSKHKMLEFAQGPGFSADAIRITGPCSYVDYLSQTLGFTPNTKLMLFYDRYTDLENARCHMLQATLSLVQTTRWNIGLRFQNETVLLRANGRLSLGNCPDVWTKQRLKMVVSPYTQTQRDVVFS